MENYNPRRGDVRLNLMDAVFVLTPSFHAITLIEEKFDRGIIDIARDYHNGKVTRAAEFVFLIAAGITGNETEVPADLAERVVATGLTHVIEPLGQFLAYACGLRP